MKKLGFWVLLTIAVVVELSLMGGDSLMARELPYAVTYADSRRCEISLSSVGSTVRLSAEADDFKRPITVDVQKSSDSQGLVLISKPYRSERVVTLSFASSAQTQELETLLAKLSHPVSVEPTADPAWLMVYPQDQRDAEDRDRDRGVYFFNVFTGKLLHHYTESLRLYGVEDDIVILTGSFRRIPPASFFRPLANGNILVGTDLNTYVMTPEDDGRLAVAFQQVRLLDSVIDDQSSNWGTPDRSWLHRARSPSGRFLMAIASSGFPPQLELFDTQTLRRFPLPEYPFSTFFRYPLPDRARIETTADYDRIQPPFEPLRYGFGYAFSDDEKYLLLVRSHGLLVLKLDLDNTDPSLHFQVAAHIPMMRAQFGEYINQESFLGFQFEGDFNDSRLFFKLKGNGSSGSEKWMLERRGDLWSFGRLGPSDLSSEWLELDVGSWVAIW